ncbi:MAG: T9SS type A sorting domain-containing protein [Bacteroidota bacterium]
MYKNSLLTFLFVLVLSSFSFAQQASKIVFEDENGFLRYVSDGENNYIPDFSYAGYKNGEAPLPELAVVKTIAPIEGDNTAHIQAVLDEVGLMPLDENGLRGAILLEAGRYEVHGTLVIRESGIVLRGVGSGSDTLTNTVLIGVGNTPNQRDIIQVGNASNSDWSQSVLGTGSVVTSDFVPSGSRSLKVAAPELYSEGNNVIIRHPSTTDWLASIDFGATDIDDPWSPNTIDIIYNRYITAVDFEEGKITLDAPIYDHFERSLSQARIYVLDKSNIKQNSGIENLRVDIETDGPLTENHARNAIRLIGVEDCWVKEVTALNFIYAAVDTRSANRVTIKDCQGLEPHSEITGARRYNFAVGRESNQILFEGCRATEGRHSFVSNGTASVSGIVFYNCTSEVDYSASEGHRRWSQGMLFDNITFSRSETNTLIGLYNRGSFGTGHGWSTTSSVAWNVTLEPFRVIILQKPPGRQNYAIACKARVTNSHRFAHPIGKADLTNQTPLITSLYVKQLETRTTMGVTPDAPARLEAELMNGMVLLNWLDIASQETAYSIEISTDNGETFTELTQLGKDETSYLHTNPPSTDGPLTYRVIAVGNNGPSPYSNEVEVSLVTSTKSIPIPNLKVFPNPFFETINIQANSQVNFVGVFDSSGQSISIQAPTPTLNTIVWNSGVYYLQIVDRQGRSSVFKMVKP